MFWYDSSMPTLDLSFTTVKEPLPDFIGASLAVYSTHSNSYHHQPDVLRKKIANKYQVPIDFIYLTAGVDQAITIQCFIWQKHTCVYTNVHLSSSH